jgi:hypothetical protein
MSVCHRRPDRGGVPADALDGPAGVAAMAWSVLNISGLPKRASASCSASSQNDTSIVFDSRQDSTARLAQSMIATR